MRQGPVLVHHFLERAADRAPDAVALIVGEERIRYRELEASAERVSRALRSAGVRKGDRVALYAKNSRFYVEHYYGALKAGACVVPLSPALVDEPLTYTLAHAGARILCVGQGALGNVRRSARWLTGVERVFIEGEPAADDAPLAPAERLHEHDLASIVYTSGSTGRPQGVTLTHENLVANTRSILGYLPLGPADRGFVVLPFHYIYGTSVLNTHVAVAGSLVLENHFTFLHAALDRLERERCTGLAGVPSTFALLLNRSNLRQRELPDLRYVTQAGGAMSPALTRRLLEALPRTRLYVMYGATEAAGRLSVLLPDEIAGAVGSIGRAIEGVELRVLGPDGREVGVGEEGELVARGRNIMQGYWNDDESTARVLDERGYHTGDLGRRDERGLLYVVGRLKEMIKARGHRISPKEIEDALSEHPLVHEAAVLGVPDELDGEAIVACCAPRAGCQLDDVELRAFLGARLPAHKLPRKFLLLQELPKNASGKIDKPALRERVATAPPQRSEASERTAP